MPVTSSSTAPASQTPTPPTYINSGITRWPAYATKAACLADLELALGVAPNPQVEEVLSRISNTDTSGWADKGSYYT